MNDVVWSPSMKRSLHEVFVAPRDQLLWQVRGSVLLDAAPGITSGQAGLPSKREAQPERKQYVRTKCRCGRVASKRYTRCLKCQRKRAGYVTEDGQGIA